jgi:hypothetical protein
VPPPPIRLHKNHSSLRKERNSIEFCGVHFRLVKGMYVIVADACLMLICHVDATMSCRSSITQEANCGVFIVDLRGFDLVI